MSVDIAGNLAAVRSRLEAAAVAAGRAPGTVKLVAVSKTVSADTVLAAYESGQRCFGENRAQELTRKAPELPGNIEWHFIGRLQRNKVRTVVRSAAWIHSVDSPALLRRVDRIAGEEERRPNVLFEVNISGESSKGGAPPEDLPPLAEATYGCGNVDCRGLMTIAPFGADEAELHRVFAALRELRDRLSADFDIPLPELSMGMSGDFPIAVAEGATMVRIGTAIFGARPAMTGGRPSC
ncbi:MAG: YggS family pyridoxal phosphate-dependent enzyme [Kiritimatiellaeota bacterium]|nr:YggS family pyridoxal phosphate-dependent enzyme [Kiritimatiellota bacterium]